MMASYPQINHTRFGEITIDQKTYEHDVYIFPNGEVKKRKKSLAKEIYGSSHKIGPNELKYLCNKKTEYLFLGIGQNGVAELTAEGKRYLDKHNIDYTVLPTPEIIEEYNQCEMQKAALIHVTC